eukprot:gb/GECH01013155.1/.p1 GENE.gb/GECH01013155.1/~~gb/GECH01013155.1/.p1  ORF type:complete len:637 (+),score=236.91 gb/GECH01013155.1/:1-1911(+)
MRRLLEKRGQTKREKNRQPLNFQQAKSQNLGWNTKSRTNVNSFTVGEHVLDTVLNSTMQPDMLHPDAYTDKVNQTPFSGPWTNTPQFTNDINDDPYPYVPETEVSQQKWEKWSEIPIERYSVKDWIDHRYAVAKHVEDKELRNKIMGLLSEPVLDIIPPDVVFDIWKKEKLEQVRQQREKEREELAAANANELEQDLDLGQEGFDPNDEDDDVKNLFRSKTRSDMFSSDKENEKSDEYVTGSEAMETEDSESKHGTELSPIADPDLAAEEEEGDAQPSEEELIDEALEAEGGLRPILFTTDGEEPTLHDILMNNADQAILDDIPKTNDELPPGAVSDLVHYFDKHIENLREQKKAEDMLSLEPKTQIIDKKEAQALLKREDFYRKLNAERLNYLSQTKPEEEIKEMIEAHREAAQEWTQSKILKHFIENRKQEAQEEFEEEREKIAWEKERREETEKLEMLEKKYKEAYQPDDIFASQADEEERASREKAKQELEEAMRKDENEEKEHDKIRKLTPKELATRIAEQAAKDITEAGNSIRTQDLFHFSFGLQTAGHQDEDMAPKRYHKVVDEDGALNIIEAMWNDGVWEYEDFKSEYRKPYELRDIRKSREKREHFRFRVENTLKYYHFLRKSGQLR